MPAVLLPGFAAQATPSRAPAVARIMVGMISADLARELRDAGLVWHPQSGDRFQLNQPELVSDVFTVSEMTIEAHHYPTGSILGFNGTTEWALDSVALEETLWLPREDQMRAVLDHDFVGLGMDGSGYAVVALVDGVPTTFAHRDAEEAYGLALLEVLRHRTP